jgi:hypothetical protein
MAASQECRMKISWVFQQNTVLDPTIDISQLKNIGSFWGSWQTWRGCQTDNVVCHSLSKADELIKRGFHSTCNFYIPNSSYQTLMQPSGVKVYEGDFLHDLDFHEDIISLHLAASVSDIVLLVGFDFVEKPKNSDRLLEHRATNYRNLIKQAIKDNILVQWVAIDHPESIRKDFLGIENLTKDTMSSVISMLSD